MPEASMGYSTSPVIIVVAWIAAVLTVGYLLTWAIAATRSMPNHGAICVLNVLLGWTIIGWIVALVMACSQKAR